jgi:hypothetical protein
MKNDFRVLVLFSFLLCFYACQNKSDPTDQAAAGLMIKNAEFKKASASCRQDSNRCIVLEANYPVVLGPGAIEKTINDSILHYVKSAFVFDEKTATKQLSLAKAAQDMIKYYDDFSNPDSNNYITPWEVEVEGTIIKNSAGIFSVSLSNYSFTGGAHPNMTMTLLNFDAKTGKTIQLKDLIKDETQLKKRVEAKFRRERELQPLEDLNEAGYFWDGEFALPAAFAIQDEGILFYYNTYEIAAYAQGPTSFVMTWEEIGDTVTHELPQK